MLPVNADQPLWHLTAVVIFYIFHKRVCCAADFGQFQKITGQQIQILDEIAKNVEREKKKVSLDVEAEVFYRIMTI